MSEKQKIGKDGQAKVYDAEKVQEKERGMKPVDHKENKMGMREMAARDTRYHLQPMPEATPPGQDPFPAPVLRGLAIGCLVGLLVGIGWAALLLNNLVVIGGWEGLFSMTPVTFYVFWAVMGLALGGFLAGAVAVLRYPTPA